MRILFIVFLFACPLLSFAQVNQRHSLSLGSVFTLGFPSFAYENRLTQNIGFGLSGSNQQISSSSSSGTLCNGTFSSKGIYAKYYFSGEKDGAFIEGDIHSVNLTFKSTRTLYGIPFSDSASVNRNYLALGGGYQWRWEHFYFEFAVGIGQIDESVVKTAQGDKLTFQKFSGRVFDISFGLYF